MHLLISVIFYGLFIFVIGVWFIVLLNIVKMFGCGGDCNQGRRECDCKDD